MFGYDPFTKPRNNKPKIACIMHPNFIKLQETKNQKNHYNIYINT